MFKSHLAFLCFHTPPVPASSKGRCDVRWPWTLGPCRKPGQWDQLRPPLDVLKRSSDAHQGS